MSLALVFSSSADGRSSDQSSYLFYLYYDNGQLFADRDYEFTYDVVPEEFVPETVNAPYPFRGEIITFSNQVAATFVFDPRRGDPEFLKGKLSVKAPYAPNGQKAVFYDSQGNQLLSVFVGESSFCNEDGVCNVDRGEDNISCSADCRNVTPLPGPEENTGGQNGMLKGLIYLIIGLAALGGWYGYRRWRSPAESGGWKKWKSGQEPPMTQMPNNFPPQQPGNLQ